MKKRRKTKGKAKGEVSDVEDESIAHADSTDSLFKDTLTSLKEKHIMEAKRFEREEERYQETKKAEREALEHQRKLEQSKLDLEQEKLAFEMIMSKDDMAVARGREIIAEIRQRKANNNA